MPAVDYIIKDAFSDPGYVKTASPYTNTQDVALAQAWATAAARDTAMASLVAIYGANRFEGGTRPKP